MYTGQSPLGIRAYTILKGNTTADVFSPSNKRSISNLLVIRSAFLNLSLCNNYYVYMRLYAPITGGSSDSPQAMPERNGALELV